MLNTDREKKLIVVCCGCCHSYNFGVDCRIAGEGARGWSFSLKTHTLKMPLLPQLPLVVMVSKSSSSFGAEGSPLLGLRCIS